MKLIFGKRPTRAGGRDLVIGGMSKQKLLKKPKLTFDQWISLARLFIDLLKVLPTWPAWLLAMWQP